MTVQTLNLADMNLVGVIHTVPWGDLQGLENLRLFSNKLSGPIPNSLATLTGLRVLWLHQNELTGSIPTGLASLHQLEQLRLDSNQLTGALPAGLGDPANQPRMQVLITYKNGLGEGQATPLGCGHQFRCGVSEPVGA